MNVDLIVSIYLDRGSTPLGSIIFKKKLFLFAMIRRVFLYFNIIFAIKKAYASRLKDDPYGTRTRVTAVKGRCLNRLTNGPG